MSAITAFQIILRIGQMISILTIGILCCTSGHFNVLLRGIEQGGDLKFFETEIGIFHGRVPDDAYVVHQIVFSVLGFSVFTMSVVFGIVYCAYGPDKGRGFELVTYTFLVIIWIPLSIVFRWAVFTKLPKGIAERREVRSEGEFIKGQFYGRQIVGSHASWSIAAELSLWLTCLFILDILVCIMVSMKTEILNKFQPAPVVCTPPVQQANIV